MVKFKKLHRSLVSTQVGTQCLEDREAIQDHIVSHYKNLLYSVDENVNTRIVERVIPSLVKAEDNISLLKVPTPEEVYPVVKSMDCSSSSGLDWFSGCFFVGVLLVHMWFKQSKISLLIEKFFFISILIWCSLF